MVIFAATDHDRREESLRFAEKIKIPSTNVFLLNFPDGRLSKCVDDIRAIQRCFAMSIKPDLVITHRFDNHPDHRTLHVVSREVFGRNGVSIFNFHIPQPFPTHFHPTFWIRVSDEAALRKVTELYGIYESENWKDYFDQERAIGLMRDAGIAAGSTYGEAFEAAEAYLTIDSRCCGIRLARNSRRLDQAEKCFPLVIENNIRVVLEPCNRVCGALTIARNSARFDGEK